MDVKFTMSLIELKRTARRRRSDCLMNLKPPGTRRLHARQGTLEIVAPWDNRGLASGCHTSRTGCRVDSLFSVALPEPYAAI
jgi:hypothetical protein